MANNSYTYSSLMHISGFQLLIPLWARTTASSLFLIWPQPLDATTLASHAFEALLEVRDGNSATMRSRPSLFRGRPRHSRYLIFSIEPAAASVRSYLHNLVLNFLILLVNMSNTQDWSHDPEPHASFHIYHATNPTKKAIAEEPDTKPSTDGFQAECLNSDQRGQAGAPASINDSEKYHGRSGFPQKCSVSTAGTGAESKPFLTLTPKSGNFPGSLKQRFSFRPRRPSFRSTVKAINDWWLVELAACMVSFSAMLALVLVIRHYDGKPLPKWPLRITIGTYIAVCSKIMSAMLLVPVIQSMSQYKCYMYRRTRTSLDTMGLVDNATRGVAGSLYLLLSKRWRYASQPLTSVLSVIIAPRSMSINRGC